jgi:transcriptional regulator with XRE-family HTH domain
MEAREATVERPYRYDLSGLNNVFLAGITIYECGRCDVKVPAIPKIAQLHGLIAKGLLLKDGLLVGDEVRFLRKNAGLAAKEFARLIQVDPAYLSRVENGKGGSFSPGTDKLARAVVAERLGGKITRDVLLEIERRPPQQLSLFEVDKDQWKTRKAA